MTENKPYDPSQEQVIKGLLDGMKLQYETLKHVTTLSSGAVVLLTALMEKIPETLRYSRYLVWAIGCFIASVFFSVLGMYAISGITLSYFGIVHDRNDPNRRPDAERESTFGNNILDSPTIP